MTTALAEIAEDNATGTTAEIYADIRRSLSVANVNLIYRHFATIDGALPWAWEILRPHFASGDIERCAQESRSLYTLGSPLRKMLPDAQLSEQDHIKISAILEFYLKANPMNLFALEILNSVFGRPANAHQRLLSPDKLLIQLKTSHFNSTAEQLMYCVSQGAAGVRPTLLRQLAAWPAYIDSIAEFVQTTCVDTRFLSQVDDVQNFARQRVSTITSSTPSKDLLPESKQAIQKFCGYFPLPLIRMTIIARYLHSTLNAAPKSQ